MLNTAFLVRRQEPGFALSSLTYGGGLVFGLCLSALLLVIIGVPAEALIDEFLIATFMDPDGLAQTVTTAAPLVLVGLASAIAMRVRFWNIGVEGQLWIGAIAATFVALNEIGPDVLRLPLMMLAAFVGGAIWIALCLVLKMRWGVSEVITTLLSGNIAFLFVQHLLFGVWRDPASSFPITQEFPDASQFASLGWGQVHSGVFVTLLIGLVIWYLLEWSRLGYYAEAAGWNTSTARQTGLPVATTIATIVLTSGGLSGLGGALIVAGTEHHLNQSLGNGYLFSAIVIAYLARSKPFWVIVTAIILAAVYTAGNVLKVFYSVPEAIIVLSQGIVLMSILISQFFSTYSINLSKQAA